MRNKANRPRMPGSGCRPSDPGRESCAREINCAKQSQFATTPHGTEPGTERGGASFATLIRVVSGPPWASCTNKANFRQTRYPTIPLFHHSNIPVPILSCETKPILPRAMGRVNAFCKRSYDEFRLAKAAAKQSQFWMASGGTGLGRRFDCGFWIEYGVAAEPPGRPRPSCTNKPNWPPAGLGRVKQSQFPTPLPIGRSAFPGGPNVRNKAN